MMPVWLPLLAMAAAQPAVPGPLLVDCLFPREAAAGARPKVDAFSLLLDDGLAFGPIGKLRMSDPAGLVRGGRFEHVRDRGDGQVSLIGVTPESGQPILILQRAPAGEHGYDAGIGSVKDAEPRLGRCFFLVGPEAGPAFEKRRAAAPR